MNSFKIFTRVSRISFFLKKQNSYHDGELIFLNNSIAVKDTIVTMGSIDTVRFLLFDDYIGKVINMTEGKVSNGYDNVIEIITTDGKIMRVCFQLSKRYQIRDIREQLISYHKAGKLHFLHLIDVLGIEDYNTIQNFKKTLNS